ncbi:MAG: archease [Chloroflexi bacterium]|nr:archease [Chloroflexota bacterium]
MTHRFIEEEATADIAFEARGKDLPEVFRSAGDAVMNVMVENLDAIEPRESRAIELKSEALDLLLLDLLQSLIYYKDAEQLLLRVKGINIDKSNSEWHLRATLEGERLDPERHQQLVDVKAVTLHDFRLEQVDGEWRAHVILDI